jgi:phosphoribosylamine--glycine ligase
MKLLVVGSGGREHALAWKLAQSERVSKIYTAPGNPGTALHGENVPIKTDDIEGLKKFALKEGIDLTVVGPELPLTLGIVDAFSKAGLRIFGPTKKAAELEGSKVFCKGLMERYGIPTAGYKKFNDSKKAREYIEDQNSPLVVKADGIAAGKGVIVCSTKDEALTAVQSIMDKREFGDAGASVVVEELLRGEEASFLAITDGRTVLPLAPAQDHKPVFDNDRGPNTGGMGAYSPALVVTPKLASEIMETVMKPTVKAMETEGRPYRGVLYAGLMIDEGRPRVLEFNCRFGDPETQPILMRLRSDLLPVLLLASAEAGGGGGGGGGGGERELGELKLDWHTKSAVCVVMASRGYPGEYEKGKVIKGLEEAAGMDDIVVFHAGTSEKEGDIVTSGGRVLGVTGLGDGINEAIENAYKAVEKISWDGAYYRGDIGAKARR